MAVNTLSLPEILDLETTINFFGRLPEPMTGDLIVVAAEVEEMSTAAIQLLLALRQNALATGHGFRLDHPSPAVTEALTVLGLPTDPDRWPIPGQPPSNHF